jgi:TIR domain-containing protein
MAGYVFVSYSRVDRAYVDQLAAHLAEAGISTWHDYDLEAGDEFAQAIESAIDECATFIVVLTPDSAKSKWVRREIARAIRLNKPTRPLLLKPCNPPVEVEGLQQEIVTDGRMPSERFVGGLPTAASTKRHDPSVGGSVRGVSRAADRRSRHQVSVRWIAIAFVFVASYVLGYAGLSEYVGFFQNSSYGDGWWDLAYYDLGLFVLNSPPFDLGPPYPLFLTIARFAAPATSLSIVICLVLEVRSGLRGPSNRLP